MINLSDVVYSREPAKVADMTSLPVKLYSRCPHCQDEASIDLKEEMISLSLNEIYNLSFTHPIEHACKNFWSVKIVFRIGVFEANPAIYHRWIKDSAKMDVIKALRKHTTFSLRECKAWAESGPHGIDKNLAEILEQAGAYIEWRY